MKVQLNSGGVEKYLNSASVRALVNERAKAAASRAGRGYRASSLDAGSRFIGFVSTGSYASRRDNAKRQTILRTLNG